ncbi:hypothetical protein ACIGXM_11275 [Kitasatospora sp. NPDC052896]|uniref:hypothetical protein n=1 Tax=Kitasatospora sp. NPDC052896 TaxID=3364061 RepID=UPI0037CBF56A
MTDDIREWFGHTAQLGGHSLGEELFLDQLDWSWGEVDHTWFRATDDRLREDPPPGSGAAGEAAAAETAPPSWFAEQVSGARSTQHRPAGRPSPRHRQPAWFSGVSWTRVIGSLFGLLTALTVTVVCLLDWLFTYHPLQDVASARTPRGLSQLWPLIVYGPWLTGCLSVLRTALDRRRAAHSWAVVVVFSGVATGLCIFDVHRTAADVIVAGLPPITGVISLHQLVRQLSGNQPPAKRPIGRRRSHRARR